MPAGDRTVEPPRDRANRYLIRRLDHTHCEEIRLSDLRIRQIPPWKASGRKAKATVSRDTIKTNSSPLADIDPATANGCTGSPGANLGRRFDPRPQSNDDAGLDRNATEGRRANASVKAVELQRSNQHPVSYTHLTLPTIYSV